MARTFTWTPAKELALQWEHEGRLSQATIAERLGTTRRTVEGWCRRPAFRTRLEVLSRSGTENRTHKAVRLRCHCAKDGNAKGTTQVKHKG